MASKIFWLGMLVIVLAFGLTVVGCKESDSGSTAIDGTWRRGSGSNYYQIKINGNNWVYSEGPAGNVGEYSKGRWNSNAAIAAPSTGTITLTVTQISPNKDGAWQNLPSQYESVKTNTATFAINAAGDTLTISSPALTTNGVWGTLAGAYQKQ